MKCTATHKKFLRQRRFDAGMKGAVARCSIYLDYVLSDKMRWSNSRINQIHSTFNNVAEKVKNGELTVDDMVKVLKAEHDADVIIPKDGRERPKGLYSDYINGVYASSDTVSVILLYVLIHIYRLGCEKTAKIIAGITDVAESVNLGYVTETDIQRSLKSEEGLEVKKLNDVG